MKEKYQRICSGSEVMAEISYHDKNPSDLVSRSCRDDSMTGFLQDVPVRLMSSTTGAPTQAKPGQQGFWSFA